MKNKIENNVTELVFILDRSGSMAGLEDDTIGGFNAMIEKQKKQTGTCYVSTVLFANESLVIHDRATLDRIAPMTDRDYVVGGCTALLDAIGDAIHHIGNVHKYARAEDVPAHTMFVITTDGMENASRRYGADEVRKLIRRQEEEFGWEFLFVGPTSTPCRPQSTSGSGRTGPSTTTPTAGAHRWSMRPWAKPSAASGQRPPCPRTGLRASTPTIRSAVRTRNKAVPIPRSAGF